MKIAIRAFALGLVLVGAAAANSIPKNTPFISGQAVTTSVPRPTCDPDDNTGCDFRP